MPKFGILVNLIKFRWWILIYTNEIEENFPNLAHQANKFLYRNPLKNSGYGLTRILKCNTTYAGTLLCVWTQNSWTILYGDVPCYGFTDPVSVRLIEVPFSEHLQWFENHDINTIKSLSKWNLWYNQNSAIAHNWLYIWTTVSYP